MRTLARTARTADEIREAMPTVFPSVERIGGELRKGQLVMFAATPASGKSYAVLWQLYKMKLPTLYFSADTSPQDQLERAAAMATGSKIEQIREELHIGGADYYGEILAKEFSHIRWVFESDPTYDDLELETAAYAEAYGDFPEIIVVDNLVNVIGEAESEYASEKESTRVLKRLNRVTGSAVWLVHHMNERKADPTYPSPRTDIANKLSQLPEVIFSIAAAGHEQRWAIVKNRTGRQDPSGSTFATVWTDLDRGQFFNTKHEYEMRNQ